ncbi:MAG TPA: hypothetical protein VK459_07585, partial [Polyangiaceae bacterium]|nr:hypothetical protein [Polyangiaceae bacterium]
MVAPDLADLEVPDLALEVPDLAPVALVLVPAVLEIEALPKRVPEGPRAGARPTGARGNFDLLLVFCRYGRATGAVRGMTPPRSRGLRLGALALAAALFWGVFSASPGLARAEILRPDPDEYLDLTREFTSVDGRRFGLATVSMYLRY